MSPLRIRLASLLLASALPLHLVAEAPVATAPAPAADIEQEDDDPIAPAQPAEDASLTPYWEALKLFRSKQAADLARGRELLTQSADAENSHAENYLGIALQNGLHGFARDKRKAVTWFMLSAQRGNAFAKANLGLGYFYGNGIRKDRAKAREWLEAALADDADFSSPRPPADFFTATPDNAASNAGTTLSGDLPIDPADRYRAMAHVVLGDLCSLEKKPAQAQEHYVKAATAGEGGRAGIRAAALKAAISYAFGQGIPRDLEKANEMLVQSKKLSRQEVIAYAHGLVEGKRLDDFAQADFEEQTADKADELHQQLQLGIAGSFADPKSKNYNPQEAARWFEVAAESNQAWAMLSLAFLYHGKSLGEPDPAKVFEWFKAAAERGKHSLGWANLAVCYQNGYGTEKDAAKAEEIFKKNRNDSIVCYLGSIGQCPTSVVTYEEELALNKTWASKNKDAHACYLLGIRHLNGWGVKADLRDAEDWLRRGTKTNYGPAWRALGDLYLAFGGYLGHDGERSHQKARECYEKAMEAGDADGTASLADMYSPPTNIKPGERQIVYMRPDPTRAEALYLRCLLIDPEHGRAHNNLAVIYAGRFNEAARSFRILEGADLRDKMIKHYEAAHKAKVPTAAWNLGNLHYEGVMGEKDYQTAYTYFETAASDGQIDARRRLGEMHEKGEGVPITYREAAYHYRLAALGGDIEALTRLCGFYIQGKGVSQDLDRATMWLTMLARRGRAGALVTLGDIMINRGEYTEAFRFFGKLLDSRVAYLQGHAYDRLSGLYQQGNGVKANPAKAKRYHDKAVALGNSSAIYKDALVLMDTKQYEEAVPLLKKASEAGSVDAEYKLSSLYFNGLGVPKDLATAIAHSRTAADRGHSEAQFSLSVLALKDTPGAPELEQAIRYAESAENAGHAKAGYVRKKLEEKRTRSAPVASEKARSL